MLDRIVGEAEPDAVEGLDQALVPLMVDLHCNLRAGQTLAESLHGVRLGLADDPVQHATAASLVTLGAA